MALDVPEQTAIIAEHKRNPLLGALRAEPHVVDPRVDFTRRAFPFGKGVIELRYLGIAHTELNRIDPPFQQLPLENLKKWNQNI